MAGGWGGGPRPGKLSGVLRRARPDDLELLLGLVAEFYVVDHHPYDEGTLRAAFPALLDGDERGVVWLICAGGKAAGDGAEGEVMGYAVITWGYSLESGGVEGLVDEVFSRRRSQGIGGAALAEVLEDCRRRGVKRMFLETESANGAARRFYARHGFEADDSIWMSLTL